MRPPGLPIDFWDVKRRGIIFPSTDIRVCPFEDCQHASSYGGLRAHIRTVHRDWPLLKRKTRPWRKIMPRPSQQENQVTASRQTSWNGKELFQEALRDRRHRSVRISCLKEQWAAILDRQNDAGSEDTHPNVVRRIWMELPDQFREQLVEPHSATTAKAEIRFSDSEVCRFIEDCYIYALENNIFHENQLHGLPDAEVFPKALPCWDDLVDDSFDVYDFMDESSESQDDYSGDMSVTEECSQEPDVQNRMSGSEQNDPDDMGIGRVAELEHQMRYVLNDSGVFMTH